MAHTPTFTQDMKLKALDTYADILSRFFGIARPAREETLFRGHVATAVVEVETAAGLARTNLAIDNETVFLYFQFREKPTMELHSVPAELDPTNFKWNVCHLVGHYPASQLTYILNEFEGRMKEIAPARAVPRPVAAA